MIGSRAAWHWEVWVKDKGLFMFSFGLSIDLFTKASGASWSSSCDSKFSFPVREGRNA